MDKAGLRKHFKELRASIPAAERAKIDERIAHNVLALPAWQEANLVLPYLSFGAEVETRTLIKAAWSAGKTVALPRCVGGTRTMKWYRIENFDGLEKSSLGVDEPPENPACEVDPAAYAHALVLVPGLTFDTNGFRLGYGGGFYDTFLKDFEGTSVGLCRRCQLSKEVPALDPHDLAVDLVVTDEVITD